MPTVLDLLGLEIPAFVQGRSLAPGMRDNSLPGREYVVSSIPFANPGDPVQSVDSLLRTLSDPSRHHCHRGRMELALQPSGRSIGAVQCEFRS